MEDSSHDQDQSADRRTGDRRRAQLPYDGPDRRKGERRAGTERRKSPRY